MDSVSMLLPVMIKSQRLWQLEKVIDQRVPLLWMLKVVGPILLFRLSLNKLKNSKVKLLKNCQLLTWLILLDLKKLDKLELQVIDLKKVLWLIRVFHVSEMLLKHSLISKMVRKVLLYHIEIQILQECYKTLLEEIRRHTWFVLLDQELNILMNQ